MTQFALLIRLPTLSQVMYIDTLQSHNQQIMKISIEHTREKKDLMHPCASQSLAMKQIKQDFHNC